MPITGTIRAGKTAFPHTNSTVSHSEDYAKRFQIDGPYTPQMVVDVLAAAAQFVA